MTAPYNTYTQQNGTGSQTQFTTGFDAQILDTDVKVYLLDANGTYVKQTSGYTISGNTVTFNTAPASGTGNVLIIRDTDVDSSKVPQFNPGSSIRGQDLDSNFKQALYAAQESSDQKVDKLTPEFLADIDMNGKKIESLGEGTVDTDAVNREQLGDLIATDITGDTTQGVVLTKTTGGSNSGDQMEISISDSSPTQKGSVIIEPASGEAINVSYASGTATVGVDKSTASQQGVVQITAPSVTNGNPITLTRPADGEVELTIADGSIDVQKIKGLDKADTSEYASTWDNDDDQVATVGAIAKRLDAIVSTTEPTTAQVGKFWYNPTEGINALYMWQGTEWKVLTSGTPYIPAGTTIVRYVDAVNGSDASGNSGFLPQSPLRTIKRAITLINASASGDGTLVVVEPGVYQEELPLRIEKNNVSIVGKSIRSCFIHPTVATENNNMWEVDSGTYIANFTMLGLKVPTNDQGSRNNAIDNDSTYGLPSNQPFAVSFRSGNPIILKSPYIQNCTHFSDAHFDNANFDPNTFPSTDAQTYSAVAGDQTSAPCGGGLLVDGSVPSQSSPIRSMVVDAFTQITLDGPGILVTNNGYAQLVSFFGTFCHYHAKAKNGGQINLSNCVTDFGRYGLIAEGKSPSAIATATVSAANSGATTVTIGAITTDSGFHGTVSRPLDHMMITIDGVDYGVVGSTANGSGWDVTITPALASNISNTAVSFALRSYISTGGHTFEYVGVGTDYGSHPDNGGVPVEANQVKEFNGGKVWQSSTDHIGKFKAGNVLTVDQISETVAVNGNITVTGTNAVNGNITVTGTVDGRDVATDGTKLDGIEAGATADQTAAEIRTLVESATDSNVFTDADHTKLNGIAAGATAYSNSDVDAHLNQSTAASGEILSWNGSDYDWIAAAAGYSDSSVDSHLNRSTAATGEVLSWNGSDYDWVAAGGVSDNSTHANSFGLGPGALDSETTGQSNTALGKDALTALTTSFSSTGIGREAGKSVTTGYFNTAVGSEALPYVTTGAYNTAVGGEALGRGTSGSNFYYATALGYRALYSNTAWYNTAVGTRSFQANTSGSFNTGLGFEAGYNNTTGTNNVFIGYQTGRANTTGSYSVGVGTDCLDNQTTGGYNAALGSGALGFMSTGSNNTAVGYETLYSSTGTSDNTGVGYKAGRLNNSGIQNVFVGTSAGENSQYGSNNVFVGYQAGDTNTHGSNNICLGNGSDVSTSNTSNEITLGNTSITSFRIPGLDYTIDSYGKVKAESFSTPANAVSALDIDLRTGNYFTKTISSNSTFTFSNPPASGTVGSFTLELTHTSGTVAWPSSVKWPADTAPTLTTGKTHLFVFVTDDGGSRYRGAALADYVN